MDDLKLMTVRALRELARKHLGPGYSRLKTKAELISALAKRMGESAKAEAEAVEKTIEHAVERVISATEGKHPAKGEAAKPEKAEKAEPRSTKKPEPKKADAKKVESDAAEAAKPAPKGGKRTTRPPEPHVSSPALAHVRDGALMPETEAIVEDIAEPGALETPAESEASAPSQPAPAEPPPRVMSQAEIDLINENLGELPPGYYDDAVVLMARDPHTLWAYWDFREETAQRAREGMYGVRAVLRLFDGGQLVREVDVAIESRAWYLHHITPGRYYRVELHFVDDQGNSRRIGPSSNAMLVPNEGPSPIIDDRFIALPYEQPFQRSAELLEHPHAGAPFPRSAQDALLARAEEGLHQEGLRGDGQPGTVEVYYEVVRGIGGSEGLIEVLRRRSRFGGHWTSSRPA